MKFKKVLAATLITTMALSTTVFGASTTPEWNNDNGETTITGDAQVVQPVLEVALPGDLAFTLDPLKIENNAQIVGGDYNIINYSSVPVKVTVSPSIVEQASSKLEIKSASAGLNEDLDVAKTTYADLSSSSDQKAIFMFAVAADTVVKTTDANEDGIFEFAYTAKGTTNVGRDAFALSGENWVAAPSAADDGLDTADVVLTGEAANDKGTGNIEFVLKKITYENQAPKGVDWLSSFTVCGCTDPNVIFEEGEVQIQAVYKMEMLGENEYSTTVGDGTPGNTSNMSAGKLNVIKD